MKKRADSTDAFTHKSFIFFIYTLLLKMNGMNLCYPKTVWNVKLKGECANRSFLKRILFFYWKYYLNTYLLLAIKFKCVFYEHLHNLPQQIDSRKN